MTKQKSPGFERKREGGRQAARAASCNSPNRTEQNNERGLLPDNRARGLLTDKRAQGLYVTSRYGYCVVFVAHGELIAVGVAMGGENVVEVDDERTMALEDALLVGVGKD